MKRLTLIQRLICRANRGHIKRARLLARWCWWKLTEAVKDSTMALFSGLVFLGALGLLITPITATATDWVYYGTYYDNDFRPVVTQLNEQGISCSVEYVTTLTNWIDGMEREVDWHYCNLYILKDGKIFPETGRIGFTSHNPVVEGNG